MWNTLMLWWKTLGLVSQGSEILVQGARYTKQSRRAKLDCSAQWHSWFTWRWILTGKSSGHWSGKSDWPIMLMASLSCTQWANKVKYEKSRRDSAHQRRQKGLASLCVSEDYTLHTPTHTSEIHVQENTRTKDLHCKGPRKIMSEFKLAAWAPYNEWQGE